MLFLGLLFRNYVEKNLIFLLPIRQVNLDGKVMGTLRKRL